MGKFARAAGMGVVWLLAVIGGVATALVAGVLLIVGVLFAFGNRSSSSAVGRQHLKPIPISQPACPYVRAMHVAAYDFELTNPVMFGGSDVGDAKAQQQFFNDLLDPKRWPAVKARIDQNMVLLDVTIRLASPHLPKRVQDQLAITRDSLRVGRIELRRARGWLDLPATASDLNRRGQYAFGNASDLIGMACGVHVGV